MGLKEKLTEMKNKTQDAIITAKVVYEKECETVYVYCLDNLRQNDEVKAKIDRKEETVEFSGILTEELKKVKLPWLFLTQDGMYFEVDQNSIKKSSVDIILKSKTEKYDTTKAKFKFRKLETTKR